jgi:hypothetical protein
VHVTEHDILLEWFERNHAADVFLAWLAASMVMEHDKLHFIKKVGNFSNAFRNLPVVVPFGALAGRFDQQGTSKIRDLRRLHNSGLQNLFRKQTQPPNIGNRATKKTEQSRSQTAVKWCEICLTAHNWRRGFFKKKVINLLGTVNISLLSRY